MLSVGFYKLKTIDNSLLFGLWIWICVHIFLYLFLYLLACRSWLRFNSGESIRQCFKTLKNCFLMFNGLENRNVISNTVSSCEREVSYFVSNRLRRDRGIN